MSPHFYYSFELKETAVYVMYTFDEHTRNFKFYDCDTVFPLAFPGNKAFLSNGVLYCGPFKNMNQAFQEQISIPNDIKDKYIIDMMIKNIIE